MFTAISMTPAEMRQGLVLRFTDGKYKFELVREGETQFRLNSVRYWGASFEDPVDIRYDEFNGVLVGTCKGLIDSVFADQHLSLPEIVGRFMEKERIFKEMFRI